MTNEIIKSPALLMLESAINSGVDPEKILKFYEAYERSEANQARKSFARDMSLCQRKMPILKKDCFNVSTKSLYTSLESIIPIAKEIYTEFGFSLIFSEGNSEKDGWVRTECSVIHCEGHVSSYYNELPPDSCGLKGTVNKTPIHSIGSTKSYGRRYLTAMIFNLATGDDNDGQKSVEYIRTEDVNFIRQRINEVGANLDRFLKFHNVESLDKLEVQHFSAVLKNLDAKEKANKESIIDNHK